MGIKVIERNLSDERVQKSIRSILRENLLCSMATVAPGNRSHINTAYFCYSQDFELYFLSYPTSLHCRNLKSNPSMAMAIFSSKQTWGEPDRGLQLFGSCQEVRGPGEKRGRALYRERFPRYGSESPSLRQLRLYQFLPRRIKVFDEVEFGGGVFVNTYVRRGHR
jgi:hypothetical protein